MFGFDFMNSVFPVIFTVMFVGIFIMFIVTAVRGIGRWHKNNNSPRLTVDATIVSKRMDVTHHHNSTTHTNSSSTWYYATFQVASGDRMELSIPPRTTATSSKATTANSPSRAPATSASSAHNPNPPPRLPPGDGIFAPSCLPLCREALDCADPKPPPLRGGGSAKPRRRGRG